MNTTAFQEKLDYLLNQNIDNLISSQAKKMDALLARTGESFVLFGAGKLGRATLTGLRKAGIEPLAFADNSPDLWGKSIEGVEVFSPQEAKQRFGGEALFVITVYTSTPVRHQLKNLGVEFISFAELGWRYPQVLLPHYAINRPYSIFAHEEHVRQALDIWADDISRKEYLAQLTWRTSLDSSVLPTSAKPREMYFQPDLFSLLPSDTLVDCGAFDGDTIRELRQQKIKYRRLIAVEPDPINYHNMEKYVSKLPEDLRNKISLFQNALGQHKETINFEATGTARTSMHSGSYEVQSVPLDYLLANEQPTYIKMDIEGAEYEALSGGRRTIQIYHPILAVCLYHCPEDLWRIPLLIQSLSDRYRLFLRRYSDDCWEQVCYAIPEERVTKRVTTT